MQRRSSTDDLDSVIATQACKRCHTRKRKCDRRQPQCSACIEADVPCVQELRASEKTLLSQLSESKSRLTTLQERVKWLESVISSRLPSLSSISSIDTGAQLDGNNNFVPFPTPPTGGLPSQSSTPVIGLSTLTCTNLLLRNGADLNGSSEQTYISASQHPSLPTLERALQLVDAHLAEFKQSHHVTDYEEAEADIRLTYGDNGLLSLENTANRFRCMALLYCSMLSQNRPEDEDSRVVCRRMMMQELNGVLAKEDLLAVQALAFLGIIAINEPGGPNLFQICGLACRTAIAIRIHRRDDVYLPLLPPFKDSTEMQKHNERRKNTFWAVYSLDRLSMHVLGQPPAIRDSDIDVDLPSIPPPNPGIINIPSAALRVHNVKQRRLYGSIQDTFYAVNAKPDTSIEEREGIVSAYVRDIQEWYDSNPLKTAFIPVSAATVARQCLDDLSYHQMILALHRPSRLIPEISSAFVSILLNSAGISVDLYRHYWKSKQILINWIHLYQIFTSCITLVYCFCEHRNRNDLVAIGPEIVNARIAQCRELLVEFGPTWAESLQYQIMFDALVESFGTQQYHQQTTHQQPLDENGQTAMSDNSIAELLSSLAEESRPDESAGVAWTPNEVMRAFGIGGHMDEDLGFR